MNKRIFSCIFLTLAVLLAVLCLPGLSPARTADAASDSDITIETLRVTLRSGAVKNSAGDYVWNADHSYADHRFTFRVSYAISGTYEHVPGSVEIVIPKSILVNRSGAHSDYYEMSLPREDAEGLTDSNLYVYREEGENLVICNRLKVPAAQNGYFEVSYLTAERILEYADYGFSGGKNPKGGSEPFKASMTVVQDNVKKTKDSEKIPVYINTTAKITGTSKAYPTYYPTWQSTWGSTPADAEKWYYLVWEIRSYISANQPYNFTLTDDFSPYGEVVAYRFAGTSEYTTNNTVTDRGNFSYGRYDYVLTRHDKAKYDALLASEDQYTVVNTATAAVDPIDRVDEDTEAEAERSWTHAIHKWERPTGHFYMWKFGRDYRNARVYDSEDIRRFDLDAFIDGKTDKIEDLAYYTYVHGYPFPWTLEDGADPDDPAAYGQVPITWVLTDNDFNLKAIDGEYLGQPTESDDENPQPGEQKQKLGPEDYRIDSIWLDFTANDTKYNDETKKFEATTVSYGADEAVTVYVEAGGSDNYTEAARWYPLTKKWTVTDSSLVSGTNGMSLIFNNEAANITGYKLLTSNRHYYTRMGAIPHITLLDSQTVKEITDPLMDEKNEPKIAVRNIADSYVYKGDTEGENTIISFTRQGTDYVTGVKRHGNIEKSVNGYTNNVVKREYTVTWSVNAGETYQDARGNRVPMTQENGIFYDLLPRGASFKRESLTVYADGVRLSPGKYEIETFANYRDSGRMLLKLSINQMADKYAFTFSTVHSWDMIRAYGEALLNSVAYETGNADIGDGRPDDGGDNNKITDRELLRDLDPDTDAEKFLYAQTNHNIHVLYAASLGLYKKVMAEQDSDYSYETTTYQDSDYSYALHFATDSHTKASNLMLFDSLENYKVASGESAGAVSDWHGTLTSVDVSQPQKLGIVPVVYYSTRENLNIAGLNVNANYDFAASRIWTKAEDFGADLSSVKAVAVDLRYGAGGKVFELSPDSPVMVRLFMRSPKTVTGDKLDPLAYNNIYLHDTHTNIDTGSAETELIHQDYTRLHYRTAADLYISKFDSSDPGLKVENIVFRLSGTSDYGTEIDEYRTTDRQGYLLFEKIERGTYTLQEVEGTPDYMSDHSERTVIISPDGSVTMDGNPISGPVDIPNDPRIHGDLRLQKMGTVDGHQELVSLDGAIFLLEGVSDYGNKIEKYVVSDNKGILLFENVEMGSYELTEVQAAEGYMTSRQTWRAVCDETGFFKLYTINEDGIEEPVNLNNYGNPFIINEPLHKLLLKKYDATNPTIFLPGAEFRLSGTSDYGNPFDLNVSTNQFGTAYFEGLEPGSYVLRETKAPDHYEPDEKERLVTVTSDGTVTVDGLDFLTGDYAGYVGFPNERKYEGVVTIVKKWLDKDGNPDASTGHPIPVVHLDTEEKIIDPPNATIDKRNWVSCVNQGNNIWNDDPLQIAVSFKRNTSLTLTEVLALPQKCRIDDGKTGYYIYFWMEDENNNGYWFDDEIAYWWSDAEIVYLPEDSSQMFESLKITELDLEGFNTSKVKNMNSLFQYCHKLEKLKVATWNTSNVTNMANAFNWSSKLENLDLSGWDTSNVTDMSSMFSNMQELSKVFVGDGWNTDNVISSNDMFMDTKNIKGQNGTKWNNTKTDKEYARIDDPENGREGYFWYKDHPDGTGHYLTLADLAETSVDEALNAPAVTGNVLTFPKEGDSDTIGLHQVTNQALWENPFGDEDPDEVYDQWIDNGDGTWTYRFRVFDHDSEYHVWEEDGSVPGYDWIDAEGNRITSSIPLTYRQGQGQDPDPLEIINKLKPDAPTPKATGSLAIRKKVTGSVPTADQGLKFTLNLTLTRYMEPIINGRYGGYDFHNGFPTKITIRDGETLTFSGIPEGTLWALSEDVPDSYTVSFNGQSSGTIDGTISTTVSAVTVTNEAQYGSLTLKKTLSAADGAELTHADRVRKFAFDIILSGPGFSGIHGGLVFTNGRATAWLSGDEELTIDGLPLGMEYTVTEQTQPGFTASPEKVQGTIKQGGASVVINNEVQRREMGSLKLLKTAPENHTESFPFHLHFSGLQPRTEYDYTLNGTEQDLFSDAAGRAYLSLQLANGDSAEFKELPKDAKVTIAEGANPLIASYSLNGTPEGQNREPNRTLSTEALTITADQTLEVRFHNETKNHEIAVRKLDDDSAYLEGAELCILDAATETEIVRWISESEEHVISLPAGAYILRELTAPAGYQKGEDVYFMVSAEGILTVEGSEEEFVYFADMINTLLPTHDLTLSKQVDGINGSKERYFKLTLTLSNLSDGIYAIDLTKAERTIPAGESDSLTHINPSAITVAEGSGSVDLWLKHGQQVRIADLPENTVVRVSEEAGDYTASWNAGTADTEGTDTGDIPLDQDLSIVFTNTKDNEVISISGIKIWDDSNDQAGRRPAFITIRLLADGVFTGQSLTLPTSSDMTWRFDNLDKYAGGREIIYTVTEDDIPDYTSEIDPGSFTITNRYAPEKIEISVRKQWQDEDDRDGIRPLSIRVTLLADGVEKETAELNAANGWYHVFTDLDEYANGKRIVYTIEEVKTNVITGIDGPETYAIEIRENAVEGYTIVNTHTHAEPPQPPEPTFPSFFLIDTELPKTGLSAKPAAKPAAVKYPGTGMELLIPSLGVTSSIVTVDFTDGEYQVEWLGMDAGLLEGSALPGKGLSVIAAHNTLGKEEYGPFARLAELNPGDRFFVRSAEGLKIFTVYANEKIGARDGAALRAAASRHENTLTLLTCADEQPGGGYASRRIVSAKPEF